MGTPRHWIGGINKIRNACEISGVVNVVKCSVEVWRRLRRGDASQEGPDLRIWRMCSSRWDPARLKKTPPR